VFDHGHRLFYCVGGLFHRGERIEGGCGREDRPV
jgi:hypothetical protein